MKQTAVRKNAEPAQPQHRVVQSKTINDNSPAAIAQRQRMELLANSASSKNSAVQRAEDEEALQGKFETAQRAEDEELLQGKFETAQRVEEEEPLQGKFHTAQRAQDEELLQGKFETVQRVEEEEPLQGKFANAQLVEDEEPLQRKFDTAQRAEDEELLQGKFETAQRVEEEEPLQGKFETAQRAEDEESLQGKFATVQRAEDEELLQGKFDTAQRVEEEEPLQGMFTAQRMDEEEPLQAKSTQAPTAQLVEQAEVKPNNTGLPNQLKSGIESLSGMSMDHVKVHYNSSQPAQLNAHAYAQGSEIHVAPGQEKHLPHEAWHVVQQAQGRVKPTMQMKAGVPVNDDVGLETEADLMGAKAMNIKNVESGSTSLGNAGNAGALQAKFYRDGEWMQDTSDSTLDERFETTTRALWKDLKKDGRIVGVDKGGSGASYSFGTKTIAISTDWLKAIETYAASGTKDPKLLRATSALTHEMSHAHDHQVRGEHPEGASHAKDDWVVGVLKTELRAWMKEARSGIENRKGKSMENTDDDRDLQYGWLAVYFMIADGTNYLAAKNNLVIGRLNKYYNDNKSDASSALADLVAGPLTGLLDTYAQQIRISYTSDESALRRVAAPHMR
jgi:Domain of unknown function (DUF4157)